MSARPPSHTLLQLVRFCAVGGVCYLASIAIFTVLYKFAGVHYLGAYVITFLIANLLGFLLNGRVTYSVSKAWDRGAFIRYLLVNGCLLLASLAAMRVLMDTLHVWYLTSTMVVAAANAPVSYFAHRVLSYRVGRPAPDGDALGRNPSL